MASLPSGTLYGTVTGQFIQAVADTTDDADRDPDSLPMTGQLRFTPSASRVAIPGSTPNPVTMFQRTIVASLDAAGYIVGADGNRGIKLVASDSPGNPTNFTYTVRLTLNEVPEFEFSFFLPGGQTVDLSSVVPIPPDIGTSIAEWQAAMSSTLANRTLAQTAATEAVAARNAAQGAAATAASLGILKASEPIPAGWSSRLILREEG